MARKEKEGHSFLKLSRLICYNISKAGIVAADVNVDLPRISKSAITSIL